MKPLRRRRAFVNNEAMVQRSARSAIVSSLLENKTVLLFSRLLGVAHSVNTRPVWRSADVSLGFSADVFCVLVSEKSVHHCYKVMTFTTIAYNVLGC